MVARYIQQDFFMPRSIRVLGWIYVAMAFLQLMILGLTDIIATAHIVMGVFFGGLHLAYGIYLYFTENRKTAS